MGIKDRIVYFFIKHFLKWVYGYNIIEVLYYSLEEVITKVFIEDIDQHVGKELIDVLKNDIYPLFKRTLYNKNLKYIDVKKSSDFFITIQKSFETGAVEKFEDIMRNPDDPNLKLKKDQINTLYSKVTKDDANKCVDIFKKMKKYL